MQVFGERKIKTVVQYICDDCGHTVDPVKDVIDAQEWLHWSDTAGYGSEFFGDMTMKKLDLCEECTFKLLGKYIKTSEYNFG